jgi:hypothetical protein
MLNGLDDLDVSLSMLDKIEAFETARLARRPWVVPHDADEDGCG